MDRIINVKGYVADQRLKEYNKIYPEYFKDPLPTRNTIVKVLPTFLKFELDCVVMRRTSKKDNQK